MLNDVRVMGVTAIARRWGIMGWTNNIKMVRHLANVSLLLLILSACEENLEDQQKQTLAFFAENRVGHTDFGVFKRGSVTDGDYVVTVHGFMNDHEICLNPHCPDDPVI